MAFVDESLRRRPSDHSIYAMAAIVVDSPDQADVRLTLESLRLGKKRRLHWRDEAPGHRVDIVEALAKLPLRGIVTVLLHGKDTRHERARRLCLERLLYELDLENIEKVTVESRRTEDRLDRGLLTSLRRCGRISRRMEVDWVSPFDEPLLWAADAVAGATTWWLDGQARYFATLAAQIRLICLE